MLSRLIGQVLSALRRGASTGAHLVARLNRASQSRPTGAQKVWTMADELRSEIERLAARTEVLREAARRRSGVLSAGRPGAKSGSDDIYDQYQGAIADLRHRTEAACEGLARLRGRQLGNRRLALELLKVEVGALSSELEHREKQLTGKL